MHSGGALSLQEFIELQKIRKCTTHKGDVFVLEEFGKRTPVQSINGSMVPVCRFGFEGNSRAQVQVNNGRYTRRRRRACSVALRVVVLCVL